MSEVVHNLILSRIDSVDTAAGFRTPNLVHNTTIQRQLIKYL